VLLVLSFFAATASMLVAAGVCAYAAYRFKKAESDAEGPQERWSFIAIILTIAWLFVGAWLHYREDFPAPWLPAD
jgi:hypothetical protein